MALETRHVGVCDEPTCTNEQETKDRVYETLAEMGWGIRTVVFRPGYPGQVTGVFCPDHKDEA